MRRRCFPDEYFALSLQHVEHGMPFSDLCGSLGIAAQTFYRWKRKFGEAVPSKIKKLKQPDDENRLNRQADTKSRYSVPLRFAYNLGGQRGGQ
jgi:putative transposase